jgi:hypothetical protein
MIWEAHYSWVAGHFSVEKTVAVLQKHFYWPETLTGCQQVYQVLHCLRYCQTDH